MRASSISFERHLFWSVALSGVMLALLVAWPLIVRLFLPSTDHDGQTHADSTGNPPADPRKLTDLIRQARERVSQLPAGVKERADLTQQLYARTADVRAVPTRKALEDAARLHAIDMAEYGFNSANDHEGLYTDHRVSIIDRTGLYSALHEHSAHAKDASDADRALKEISRSLEDASAQRVLRLDSFNAVGIGCAEKAGRVACVRLMGQLEGELTSGFPETVAPGTVLQFQPIFSGAPVTATEWKLMDLLGNGLKVPTGARSGGVLVPLDFRGELRLRVNVRRTNQTTVLDGPMADVR